MPGRDYFARMCRSLVFSVIICVLNVHYAAGQAVLWTGGSGNELWNDPANWSPQTVPDASAGLLLDNSSVPGDYRVILPDVPVTLQSIAVRPSPGRKIELLLPSSNRNNNALVLTGSGYPLLLAAGAVFRNACGVSSGPSISLADSFRIEDGGRYVHSTRSTHASSLLDWLSTAPGTGKGIFEFDVPRASYTISVSNRTYGSLVLRATAYGQPVNYTCSGSNPLHVRGNLDIGSDVTLSVDLATAKGNIDVDGDLLQAGGTLNLGSGAGDSSVLHLAGDWLQQDSAFITSAAGAFPWLEFRGSRQQNISAAGTVSGNAGLRIRNPNGVRLLHSLSLNSAFDLATGSLLTTASFLLTLGPGCRLYADSLKTENFIDGPLCRHLNDGVPFALFPVGTGGVQRWMELKKPSGVFTAGYMDRNPASLAGQMGTGIDHISSKEYWYLQTTGPVAAQVELSHAVPQSGSITDPAVLRVSQLQSGTWKDAGESAFTGDLLTGSVISDTIPDFSGVFFTLASALAIENPLPLETVGLQVKRKDGRIIFDWNAGLTGETEAFAIVLADRGDGQTMEKVKVGKGGPEYSWSMPDTLPTTVVHRWRLDLLGRQGKLGQGEVVLLPALPQSLPDVVVLRSVTGGTNRLLLRTSVSGSCSLSLCAVSGATVYRNTWQYRAGANELELSLPPLVRGMYFLRAIFSGGGEKTVRFIL